MNADRMREIGRDMQVDADPTIVAAGEFVLDAAEGLDSLTGEDIEMHASTIVAAYAEDPGPVPDGEVVTTSAAIQGQEPARRDLTELTTRYAHQVQLGCDLTAHRDLGFCAGCTGGPAVELVGWRLLAMAERGIPDRPGRPT